LPVKRGTDALDWAKRWHRLGDLPFGSSYNARLRSLTNEFAGPDLDGRRPNGNALNQLRTNEVALQGARFPITGFVAAKQFWELREFHLTSSGFAPHTVNLEPARDFDIAKTGHTGLEGTRSAELSSYLIADADAGKFTNPNPPMIPSSGVAHDLDPSVGIEVRDSFALNTCAGCHRHETDTRHFMHITLLGAMEPSDKADDRARIVVPEGSTDASVVLSNFMRAEISPGGARYEDFTALLTTRPERLRNAPGMRMCAR